MTTLLLRGGFETGCFLEALSRLHLRPVDPLPPPKSSCQGHFVNIVGFICQGGGLNRGKAVINGWRPVH
eukprot:Skav222799  [mRNA]  locus=scaffold1419:325477:328044:+ [translate_table: standard]